MARKTFLQNSLQTRIILGTLIIFLISIWSLALFSSQMLRKDMEKLLGDQQFSTVSILAAEINRELQDRQEALEKVSARISPSLLADSAALQASLEERVYMHTLFNAGVIAYRLDGTAIAEVPRTAGRIGLNYMEIDTVSAALREGKATIGRPVTGKKLLVPVFGMAAPIRDAQGTVIGALAGVTDLSRPNFLDIIQEGRYGMNGGYLLVAPQHRLIIAATDKSRIMETLPAQGIKPLIDRFIEGYEGSSVLVNPLGIEILASVKGVSVTGWILAAVLPTAEAFSPIHAMQRHMLLTTICLTLLAAGLTWWLLRRELSPMVLAAKTLTSMSGPSQLQQTLSIIHDDEIGQLISGFNRQLEARRLQDSALQASELRFRDLLQNVPSVAVQGYGADGVTHYWNRASEQLFGYSADEAIGRNLLDLIVPQEMHQQVREAMWELFENGLSIPAEEVSLRRNDGTTVSVFVSHTHVQVPGRPPEMFCVCIDLTLRKHAEQRFVDLVNTTEGIVWEADASTFDFTYVSQQAERLLGFPVSDWQRPGFWVDQLHADDKVWAPEYCASCTGRMEPHDFEYRFIARDGRTVWLRDLVTVVAEEGKPRWLRGLMVDITQHKEAALQLEQALLKAEAATQAKSEFLAHMSHEIRTPMNAIVGAAQLIEREHLTPRQLGYGKIIRDSSQVMLTLIDEILDLSKVESGCIELCNEPFSLDKIIDDLAGVAMISVQGKDLEISFDLTPDLPPLLIGDANRLKQVLSNLISNAIKFTEHGEIILRVQKVSEAAGKVRLRFMLSDTGIGIPADKLESIFDPFVQAASVITRTQSGTGLGLAICRQLVELMDGSIEVESSAGQGSCFSFTAAFQLSAGISEISAVPWMSGRRIGLVDANVTTRQISGDLLRSIGAEVIAGPTWGNLYARLAESPADAVVISIKAYHDMLAQGLPQLPVPLILALQSGNEEIVADIPGRRVGQLIKPLTRRPLLDQLAIALGMPADAQEGATPLPLLPLAGRRVLMVEDNQFNRHVLEGMLQHMGIEVDVAVDGHDGIEYFQVGSPYDAILMDLHLPGLDGFGCTRAIRQLPEGRQVPIIALTANVLSTTVDECKEAGMNAHLVKPVEMDTLHRSLVHWILGEASAMPLPRMPVDVDPADGLPDNLPGIDRVQASAWSNGSARALAKLLERMLAHSGSDHEKLVLQIAAGQLDLAAQTAHDLTGVAATVGAGVLALATRQLDSEIRKGTPDSAVAQAALDKIAGEFAHLRAAQEILRVRQN